MEAGSQGTGAVAESGYPICKLEPKSDRDEDENGKRGEKGEMLIGKVMGF